MKPTVENGYSEGKGVIIDHARRAFWRWAILFLIYACLFGKSSLTGE